ncbi:unnamed protein product [Calypogeia fissa]
MSLDNTTLLANMTSLVAFSSGDPVVANTWADFEYPPVGVYHKNMLRLWLRDASDNPVSRICGVDWLEPIAFAVEVTTTSGAPATLQIPPEPDSVSAAGYYMAPITPIYTGDYIATITVASIHISNSPLYFTVGSERFSKLINALWFAKLD